MENLPLYISVIFGLTTLVGILIFYKATHYSKSFLIILLFWMVLQTVLSLLGFYKTVDSTPPRFSVLLFPTLILMVVLFITNKGKAFIDNIDIKLLTLFSMIRVPVEIVLFLLCAYHLVPELMTFEGRNFDILSGLSAPIIYYFGFVKKRMNRTVLLIWNFTCLALLINVVYYAVFSIPSVAQLYSFDQPNIAVLYFPFIFLPSCLVPLVLFSHFVSIRQILNNPSI